MRHPPSTDGSHKLALPPFFYCWGILPCVSWLLHPYAHCLLKSIFDSYAKIVKRLSNIVVVLIVGYQPGIEVTGSYLFAAQGAIVDLADVRLVDNL